MIAPHFVFHEHLSNDLHEARLVERDEPRELLLLVVPHKDQRFDGTLWVATTQLHYSKLEGGGRRGGVCVCAL